MSLDFHAKNSTFPRRSRAASLLVIASSLLCGAARSDEDVCAHKVLESGMHQGQYNFHYKSWAWRKKADEYSGESDGAYLYCHCVKNDSMANSLFVRWDGVGLKMFIGPGDFGSIVSAYSDSKEGHTQSTLWYGPKPDKIMVDTVVNLASAAPVAAPAVSVPATNTQASSVKKQPLKTSVSAAYPDLEKIASLTGKPLGALSENDIIAQAEKNPRVLVKFSMDFESSIEYDADTGKPAAIIYHCQYFIPSLMLHGLGGAFPPDRPLLYMRFNDSVVQKAVFGSEQPFPLRASWKSPSPPDYEGQIQASTSSLAQKNTTMEFLDSTGTHVLVRMPVAFYTQVTNESTTVSIR